MNRLSRRLPLEPLVTRSPTTAQRPVDVPATPQRITAGVMTMRPTLRVSPLAGSRRSRRLIAGAAIAVVVGSFAVSCTRNDVVVPTDSGSATENVALSRISDTPASAIADRAARDETSARGVMAGSSGVANEFAKQSVPDASPAPAPATPAGLPSASAVAQPTAASSMIIRNGWAGIEVDSLDTAIARVRALAARVGGFVANTTVQGGRDQLRSASLEVKIPSERFDEALAGLAPIGKVESVNVSAQDVGEEYVDIAARVENAHRLETRLIALLANRTGKLQDVLSVERELARVREEIERYEGRLRYLRTRVATSTLTITVHERAPIIVPVAGDGPITIAFRQAWRNFVNFVAALISSLGVLIPLGILVFVGWLGVRRWAPWRPTGGTPPAAGAVSGD